MLQVPRESEQRKFCLENVKPLSIDPESPVHSIYIAIAEKGGTLIVVGGWAIIDVN